MKDIDELITRSLNTEEAAAFNRLGEQGLFEKVAESFRGKSRNLVIMAMLSSWILIGMAIYGIVRFFDGSTVQDQILWAAIAVICLIGHGLTKIWYWMELNRNSLMREIKRVELQIARLSFRKAAEPTENDTVA